MIRRMAGGALGLAVPAAIATFATMSTAARDELVEHGLSCVFRDVTSIPCPFCGMTHALARLASLDWAGAFRAHPLWPLVIAAHVTGAALLWRTRPSAARWFGNPRTLLAIIALTWTVNVINQVR
jgi:hypothetical protein